MPLRSPFRHKPTPNFHPQELDALKEDEPIYKLHGKVLVRQDPTEAKAINKGRLDMIEKELCVEGGRGEGLGRAAPQFGTDGWMIHLLTPPSAPRAHPHRRRPQEEAGRKDWRGASGANKNPQRALGDAAGAAAGGMSMLCKP
jgi:hypothetical protein